MKQKKANSPQAELRLLPTLTVGQLAKKYESLFGRPTKSRNKPNLIKQLAWRIQELDEGGLSVRAHRRIAELGDRLPTAWQQKAARRARESKVARDPRLPAIGTTLTRNYGGSDYSVKVLDNGFEYCGEIFDSLSTIAKRITGKSWNGFKFFNLLNGAA